MTGNSNSQPDEHIQETFAGLGKSQESNVPSSRKITEEEPGFLGIINSKGNQHQIMTSPRKETAYFSNPKATEAPDTDNPFNLNNDGDGSEDSNRLKEEKKTKVENRSEHTVS